MFFNILLAASLASAQAPAASGPVLPTYLALTPNLHDFTRFADGGPDSNWYIGYNNAWIVKLPPAPRGEFARAFIGAKIGRAKTRAHPERPWLREPLEGTVYVAISPVPGFSSEQSFFLADTADIAIEPDPQTFVEGVGSGEWFWAEIPMALVNFTRPNYLIIWSPTKAFTQAASSPILAAAAAPPEEARREPAAWNHHGISGVPPRNPSGALQTPLNNIFPALALKLAPAAADEVAVSEFSLLRGPRRSVASFSVGGENIVEAWVESSRDGLDWTRLSRLQRRQPFSFTIPAEKMPPAGWYLRGAARDALGTVGLSDPYEIPHAR